jgi:hypothetical protein
VRSHQGDKNTRINTKSSTPSSSIIRYRKAESSCRHLATNFTKPFQEEMLPFPWHSQSGCRFSSSESYSPWQDCAIGGDEKTLFTVVPEPNAGKWATGQIYALWWRPFGPFQDPRPTQQFLIPIRRSNPYRGVTITTASGLKSLSIVIAHGIDR